jgi:hypothetical protein
MAVALTFGLALAGCSQPETEKQAAGPTLVSTAWDGPAVKSSPEVWKTHLAATTSETGIGYLTGTQTGTQTYSDGNTKGTSRNLTYELLGELGVDGSWYKTITANHDMDSYGNETVRPPLSQSLPQYNGGNSIIHGVLSNIDARATARDDLLPGLATQAEALRAFFASAKGSYSSLATTFQALQTAEANIENKANRTNGLTTYRTTVDAQRDAILNKIFEGKASERTEFDKYFDAYTKGQYLISADWNTGSRTVNGAGGTNVTAAATAFDTARNVIIGTLSSTTAGNYSVGRSIGNISGIGTKTRVDIQFGEMITAMKLQITEALGITGETNADKMAEALIIQLGQDNEEFRAFINDLQAEGVFSDLLNAISWLASTNSQSNTRLAKATIIANPDLTKGVMKSEKGSFTWEIPQQENNIG